MYVIYVEDFAPGGNGERQMNLFRIGLTKEELHPAIDEALKVSNRIDIIEEEHHA